MIRTKVPKSYKRLFRIRKSNNPIYPDMPWQLFALHENGWGIYEYQHATFFRTQQQAVEVAELNAKAYRTLGLVAPY